MIIKDLIEELKKCPQDMSVIVGTTEDITINIVYDFPLGDPANPKCKYQDVVLIE